MANSSPRAGERPELTPERNIEIAERDSFPASDAPAATTSQGSRAVPAGEMMHAAGSHPKPPDDAVALIRRFADQESAKLAMETLVREGPIDPRCAEIVIAGGAVCLRVETCAKDRARLDALMARSGGA